MKKLKIFKIFALAVTTISMSGCFGGSNNTNKENNTITDNSGKTTDDSKKTTDDSGKTTDNSEKEVNATSVSLNETAITMELDDTLQLIATILPEDTTNKTLTWTVNSSGASKVAISNTGLVKAIGTGNATITVKTINGKSATCKITVVDTPLINNEKFSKEKLYIYSGTLSFRGVDTPFDVRYNFKTDGSCVISDQVKQTTKNQTYRIRDDMLYIYKDTECSQLDEMFFYYDNVLMLASVIPLVLIQDGSAVSQRGTSTLGYYAIIEAKVGDTLAVLTGNDSSKGYYVVLQQNGVLKDTSNGKNIKYINSDQLTASDFDTSTAGTKIIRIKIGTSKTYNCLFIVNE